MRLTHQEKIFITSFNLLQGDLFGDSLDALVHTPKMHHPCIVLLEIPPPCSVLTMISALYRILEKSPPSPIMFS